MCAAVVGVGECAEAFLTGRIEEVEAVGFAVNGELFYLDSVQLWWMCRAE